VEPSRRSYRPAPPGIAAGGVAVSLLEVACGAVPEAVSTREVACGTVPYAVTSLELAYGTVP